MGKGGQLAGVKPMSISGRFNSERERLLGMTEEERLFRKQWLQDQHLSPNEPRVVPEMYKATFNPIRRFYRWPLDQVGKALTPILGETTATAVRVLSGKFFLGVAAAYWFTYYFKYNGNDWTKRGGWRIYNSRPVAYPGDPGYPLVTDKQPHEYAAGKFDKFELDL